MMSEILEADLHDPDVFADEWQECLWTDGPRSARARQLMRIARERPGAELERIFEAKLAEFQRYRNHREDREPTVWNLPLRLVESLWDDVRFSPRRDVFMTLIYVFLAVVGMELLKPSLQNRTSDKAAPPPLPSSTRDTAAEGTSVLPAKVDAWLAEEFQKAADAIDLRTVISDKFDANVEQANVEHLLNRKLEQICRSARLEEAVIQQLQASVARVVINSVDDVAATAQSPSAPISVVSPSMLLARIQQSLEKQKLDAKTRERLCAMMCEEPVRKALIEALLVRDEYVTSSTVDHEAAPTTETATVSTGAGK